MKNYSTILKASVLSLFLALLCGKVGAANFDGVVDLPDEMRIDGTRIDVKLNGVGYRSKFFFKIYVGALYLPEKSASTDIILEQPGPKRIFMHFVYEEVEKEKIINGWNEGFANNNDEETLAKLADRIKQFNDYFGSVREGDEIIMDYIPGKGTRVTLKGNEVGMVEGEDFFQALLKIWIGDEPADGGLKDAMLGIE